jgi:hypothetical protein
VIASRCGISVCNQGMSMNQDQTVGTKYKSAAR